MAAGGLWSTSCGWNEPRRQYRSSVVGECGAGTRSLMLMVSDGIELGGRGMEVTRSGLKLRT